MDNRHYILFVIFSLFLVPGNALAGNLYSNDSDTCSLYSNSEGAIAEDTLFIRTLSDTTIQLSALDGATYYAWAPKETLNDSTLREPMASVPAFETQTYYLKAMSESDINLIANGDFEQGNIGFTSQYNYNAFSLYSSGEYSVGDNPHSFHLNWVNCQGHGNMLIANGSSQPNTVVYQTDITVEPFTDYAISFEATSVLGYVLNTPIFQFSIDDNMLGEEFTISDSSCDWNRYYQIWNSGSNTSATIKIINQVALPNGNDFAIDNISFKKICVVEDSIVISNVNRLRKTDTLYCGNEPCSIYPFENISSTGQYTQMIHYGNYDSIYKLNIVVESVSYDTIYDTITYGETYFYNGRVITQGGYYNDTLQKYTGCDSIITLALTFFTNEINMDNATHIACEGYLSSEVLQSNADRTVTICPETANGRVVLTFEEFSVHNADTLFVYQGEDVYAPILTTADNIPYFVGNSLLNESITPSLMSNSGCLTVRLKTGNNTNSNFKARISCVALCQNPFASLQATFTSRNSFSQREKSYGTMYDTTETSTGIVLTQYNTVDVCRGDTVVLRAKVLFPENDISYHQDSTNCIYYWNFGNGMDTTLYYTDSVAFVCNIAEGYDLSLVVTDTANGGCQSKNSINTRVRVSDNPIINFSSQTTCQDQPISMLLNVEKPLSFERKAKEKFDSIVFIPDGPNCQQLSSTGCYETPVIFTQFRPNDVVNSVDDILSICINMEHSFLGDLGFQIVCPNGQSAILKYNTHSGPANLGIPSGDGLNPCSVNSNPHGTGWTYCFSNQYLEGSRGVITGDILGTVDSTNVTAQTGYFQTPIQNYVSETVDLNGLAGLIGCPLNGEWSIRICDNWQEDNGYVFWWDIELQQTTQQDWNYEVYYDSISWEGDLISTVVGDTLAYINGYSDTTGVLQYNIRLTDDFGCIYLDSATLTIEPVLRDTIDVSICEGTSYSFGRQTATNLTIEGTYYDTITTATGCNDIQVLHLTVNPVYEEEPVSVFICEGDSVEFADEIFRNEGIYERILTTVNGCDSSVSLNLVVHPYYDDTIPAFRCVGEEYTENNFSESQAGTYIQRLQTVNGCDSTVTLLLSVGDTSYVFYEELVCNGEPFSGYGFSVSDAGTYVQNLQTFEGCDSTIVLNLSYSLSQNIVINAFICEGDTYNDNGFVESEKGEYFKDGLFTYNGCDSTVTLYLDYYPYYNDTIHAYIEEGMFYRSNGFYEAQSGVYENYGKTIHGCDSITILDLHIIPSLLLNVPNAFTPMQENNNIFYIYPVEGEDIELLVFEIYDRWGTKVFATNDITKGWDGKYKGSYCKQGVYIYRVLYCAPNRTTQEKQGELMLYY